MVYQFLTKLDWFSTLFPRIPVPIQKQIEKKLEQYCHENGIQLSQLNSSARKASAPPADAGRGNYEDNYEPRHVERDNSINRTAASGSYRWEHDDRDAVRERRRDDFDTYPDRERGRDYERERLHERERKIERSRERERGRRDFERVDERRDYEDRRDYKRDYERVDERRDYERSVERRDYERSKERRDYERIDERHEGRERVREGERHKDKHKKKKRKHHRSRSRSRNGSKKERKREREARSD